MPRSNLQMIHNLQKALNSHGQNILYNTTQFYSKEQSRPVTLYVVKKAFLDEERDKMVSTELFSSTSQIQIVLFLRDLWYEYNGWELPTDNEYWNNAKRVYRLRKGIDD